MITADKTILREVLDNRPSGTRSCLAAALGENRGFVTRITGPAHPVPIPAGHIDVSRAQKAKPQQLNEFLGFWDRNLVAGTGFEPVTFRL
jgi:hypothetical protein